MFANDVLKGKKILVTGGGTGLGQSFTKRFVELGAEIVICGRRKEVLEDAVCQLQEAGGRATFFVCDVRSSEAVEKMFDEIWKDGPLDGLVNNAAGNFIAKTEQLSAFDMFGTVPDWRTGVVRSAEAILKPRGYSLDWLAFADAWRPQ